MRLATKLKMFSVAGLSVFAFANSPFTSNNEAYSLGNGDVFNSLDGNFAIAPLTPAPAEQPQNIEPYAKPAQLNEEGTSFDCTSFEVKHNRPDNIPADTFQAALCAETIFGTPAEILIGVSATECGHGTSKANDSKNPDKTCRDEGTQNSASAAGPMQFIPCTWDSVHSGPNGCWKSPNVRGEWNFDNKTIPSVSSRKGHGKDCDGDSKANVHSVYDSMCASSAMLKPMIDGSGVDEALQYYNGGSARTRNSSATSKYSARVQTVANETSIVLGR